MHDRDADNAGGLEALMTAYQGGSLPAFERLYADVAPALLGYLTSLARDRGRAQDLLQEAFLQIHRSRRAYRPGLPVRPWVFAIARHVWLMDRRARGRRPDTVPGGQSATVPTLPNLPVPPEVDGLAERDRLTRALSTLPPDRREALLLHHVWGFSFAEIGQMLGIRADAAKLRSSRGMADLRGALGGDRD